MIQFKEIVFVRIKGQGKTSSKLQELRAAMRKLMDWSFTSNHHEINEVFMNYENKAIYNNGIIIRKLHNGHYQVQLVTSIPRESCSITANTSFYQHKNFINYTFERSIFHSNPVPFFESLGYKDHNVFDLKEAEYYKSLTYGVEVIIYPKNHYVEIVESFANNSEIDYRESAANQLLNLLKGVLDGANEVVLSSGNMKPQDFLQEYN